MNKRELIKLLEKFPDDMEIWVSDRGCCEGAIPLQKVEKVSAYDTPLDGDLVEDEYYYIMNLKNQIEEFLKKGYILSKDKIVVTKEIILLNNG